MILHVVDVSNPQADEQMFSVYETLQGLKVQDKPIITVFNKPSAGEEALQSSPADPRVLL